MMRITKLETILKQITDITEITKVYTLYDGENVVYSGVEVLNSLARYSEFYVDSEFSIIFGHYVNTHWNNYLKAYKAMDSEYNPIHNYDNTEKIVDTVENGKITTTNTPNNTVTSDSPANSKTENYTTTNDDSSIGRLENYSVNTVGTENRYTTTTTTTGNETTEINHENVTVNFELDNKTEFTGDTVNTHTLTKKGNIGVTSSQELIVSEIDLRRNCILDLFIDSFAQIYLFIGGCVSDIEFIYE